MTRAGQPSVNRFVNPKSTPPDPNLLRSWVRSAQAGEQRGQQHIYEAFASKMLLAIRRYIPGEQEALDVLQDGFIKVFRNWLDSWNRQPSSEPIESSSSYEVRDSGITILG